jgi:hypothetical protein
MRFTAHGYRKLTPIFHGIPQLCFRSLTPAGLDGQWALINHAPGDTQSMDNFIHAMMGQSPFVPSS